LAKGDVTPDQIIELWRRLGYSIKRESSLISHARPYVMFGAARLYASERNPNVLIALIQHTLHRLGYPCACSEHLDHTGLKARCRLTIGPGRRPVTCSCASDTSIDDARFSAALHAFLQLFVLLPDERTFPRAA
jgi:hypothetical protein